MIEYERGGAQSPLLQTAVDTEQFRNVQESERYGIHVSGIKNKHLPFLLSFLVLYEVD